MSSSRRIPLVLACLILAVSLGVVGGFAWGFQSHRTGLFPYDLLKGVATGQWRPPPPQEPGRWRLRDGRRPWLLDDPEAFTLAALEELGYASGTTTAPEQAGVGVNTEGRWPGLNLVTSGHAPEAVLMDPTGEVVHRWSAEWARVFPEQVGKLEPPRPYYRRAKLLPNGDLLTLFVDRGLFRLNRESEVVWAWSGGAHHDLAVSGGSIWTLAREPELRPELDPRVPMIDDALVRLDLNTGAQQQRFTLWQALADSAYAPLLKKVRMRRDADPLHTNTVKVLDGKFFSKNPAFKQGNLLVSLRHVDLVLIIDPQLQRVVWALTGPWHQPHEPTLVAPGHLLIFDNMGAWPRSRVLEIDPATQQIVWAYDGGTTPLISETCGTAQRLPGGTTLAVASDTGRAVEVDRKGRVVWSYTSPARAGEDNELIATLFQVERIWGAALGPWKPPSPVPQEAVELTPEDP